MLSASVSQATAWSDQPKSLQFHSSSGTSSLGSTYALVCQFLLHQMFMRSSEMGRFRQPFRNKILKRFASRSKTDFPSSLTTAFKRVTWSA